MDVLDDFAVGLNSYVDVVAVPTACISKGDNDLAASVGVWAEQVLPPLHDSIDHVVPLDVVMRG